MEFLDLVYTVIKNQEIFRPLLEGNEAETRWLLIDPLFLDGLGYDRTDIIVEYNLNSENRVNKYKKVDYNILVHNKPKLLVEAKSLGLDLYAEYSQLEEYYNRILSENTFNKGELVGILTDGDVYLFYSNYADDDTMDKEPYYSIRLSVSEDMEKVKLLEYSKSNLENLTNIQVVSDEHYDLYTQYRIDEIVGAYTYFHTQKQEVCIDKVYLRGKVEPKIKNLKQLYRHLIKEIDLLKPSLLYYLAKQEDLQNNGKIVNAKFSCRKINSSEMVYKNSNGDIHISIPNTDSGIVDRIIYLCKVGNYGLHNVCLTLKEKE